MRESFFLAEARPRAHNKFEQIVFKNCLIYLTGQTKGGLYAGASAGYGVGASAALGGNVDESGGAGGLGSEAHAGGISTKTVKLSQTPQQPYQVCH